MNQQANVIDLQQQASQDARSVLDEIVREGARRMLQTAIEEEVAVYIDAHQDLRDEHGHRIVVRNGHMPEREVLTGAGPLKVKKPRVDDRREGQRFTSAILPPYLRRSPSIDALIPVLYLKGISTGDFTEALTAILGEGAVGLSAANIVRLKEGWQQEYDEWAKRDLSGKRYVYMWADAIYFNVRLSKERPCMLVIMGATPEGKKELVGLLDGERESKISWKELLLDLKRRGLKEGPLLAVADGALGFWPALEEVYPGTREQRCWVHKTANVLDKLPKRLQSGAKKKIHAMYRAATKQQALEAFDDFMALYEEKYPKACACLRKDKDVLFTFYDFPAAHWKHLRTTNPIESTFATVRHRTRQTKGCGSRQATLMMVYKLGREAEKRWRCLDGSRFIVEVLRGVKFIDGQAQADDRLAA
jgi:transposase-like protein